MSGMVKLTTTFPSGRKVETNVDVLNENDPYMAGGLYSPHSREVLLDPNIPNYLSAHDLIANYLDRLINDPTYARTKDDPKQIQNILLKAGFDPNNASHVDALMQCLTLRSKPGHEKTYLHEMRPIVDAMVKADAAPQDR